MKVDRNNRMLAGVCAGIAKYTNVDVTLVRVAFLAAFFFTGIGIFLYPIFWLLMEKD